MSHRRLCHHSRFGFCAVRSTFVTRASSHTTSAAKPGSGSGPAAGLKGSAPGRKSTPRLSPSLARSRSWISGSGSARADRRVELDESELRHRQAERAGELADYDLRDERLRPLPGAAELEDVQPVVVGFDERRERPALPQRRHVPRRGDPPHARERTAGSRPTAASRPCTGHGPTGRVPVPGTKTRPRRPWPDRTSPRAWHEDMSDSVYSSPSSQGSRPGSPPPAASTRRGRK